MPQRDRVLEPGGCQNARHARRLPPSVREAHPGDVHHDRTRRGITAVGRRRQRTRSMRWRACGTARSATGAGRSATPSPGRSPRSRRTRASTRSRTPRPTRSPSASPTLTPMLDARVFYAGSGSEAVDSAMKLARLAHVQAGHPERRLIISRVRGYHGTNYGGTSAQGLALNKVGYGELLADVVQVPSDDIEALSVLMAERSGRTRCSDHRAGAGSRRRLPAGRRVPGRGSAAVRPARRPAHLRRGDHRVRTDGHRGSPPSTTA